MKKKMVLIAEPIVNTPMVDDIVGVFLIRDTNNPSFFGRVIVENGKLSIGVLKSTPLIPKYEEEIIDYLKGFITTYTIPEKAMNFASTDKAGRDSVMDNLDDLKKNPEKWLMLLHSFFPAISYYEEREETEFPIYEDNMFLASLKNK